MTPLEYLIGIRADGKQAERAAKGVEKALGGVDRAAGLVNNALSMIGVGFGAQQLGSMVMRTVEWGGRIKDLSAQLNISAENVQAWDYAAKQSGASIEEIAGSMKFLQLSMVEALANPNANSRSFFASLGYDVQKLKAARPDQVFESIARAVGQLPPSAKLTADLVDILGRGAERLVPAFRDGFAEASQAAYDMGLVLDGSIISRLDDIGDKIDQFKTKANAVVGENLVALTDEAVGKRRESVVSQEYRRIATGEPGTVGSSRLSEFLTTSLAGAQSARYVEGLASAGATGVNLPTYSPVTREMLEELKASRKAAEVTAAETKNLANSLK
jgi:hypothetical protein